LSATPPVEPPVAAPAAKVEPNPAVEAATSAKSGDPLSGFGEDEIEDLVEEVQEADLDPLLAEAATASLPSLEVDQAAIELEQPSIGAASAQSLELGGGAGSAGASSAAEATPGSFEVDHGIDPDWSSAEVPPVSAEPEGIELPLATEAAESPVSEAEPEPSIEQAPGVESTEPLTLTELAEDADLFEDPELQVASLAAEDEREIVIPVELTGEDASVRRFKLTLRLRLDPVD
jgi:hypothetical protein